MTPIPSPAAGIGLSIPQDTLQIAMIALMLVLIGAYAVLFWAIYRSMRGHMRVRCPEQGRMAVIRAAITPEGVPFDVIDCSLLPADRPVDCARGCLSHRAA